ncbi:D-inositol-3-phosphate glycosyltransferase [Streptomyces sp. enrichment culture]|uniref:glycosyltransferase family 4 protein n=1 Tax=Streptomyces sp. enrichment culture TaxID=1795815 RepID=UPI003F557030
MRILTFLPTHEPPAFLRVMAAAGHEVHVVTTLRSHEGPREVDGVRAWPLGYWWRAEQAARPDVVVTVAGDRQAKRLVPGLRRVPLLVLPHTDADFGEFEEACIRLLPAAQQQGARFTVPADPLAGHEVRVVAWIHFGVPYRRAGSETMLHTMMRALRETGMGVLVVCSSMPEAPPSWDVDGVPYVHLGPHAAELLVRSMRPQVLVTHHNYAARATGLAKEIGARSVLLMHSDHDYSARSMQAGPDLIVYNTEWVRTSLAARYLEVERTPSLIVHPPVVADEHRAPCAGDRVTLVNLSSDKGVHTWREAARALPHLPFLGVTGAHGPQITGPALPNVRVIPQTSDMRGDVWARTRVLLMPSVYESYGMAAVEGLASGLPVIAHPTPGLREALGDAAMFLDRDDVSAWTAAVRELYPDGDRRAEASAAALARSAFLADRTGAELKWWVEAVGRLPD